MMTATAAMARAAAAASLAAALAVLRVVLGGHGQAVNQQRLQLWQVQQPCLQLLGSS